MRPHTIRELQRWRLTPPALLIIAIMWTQAAAFGQWVHYATADVPRNADGTADVGAK